MGAASTEAWPTATCGQCGREVEARDGLNVERHRCEHGYNCNGRSSTCPHCYRARIERKPREA